MGVLALQVTSLTILYSTVHSGEEFPTQMASNAEMFPFDDVIISHLCLGMLNENNVQGWFINRPCRAGPSGSSDGDSVFVMFHSSDNFNCLDQKRPHIGRGKL